MLATAASVSRSLLCDTEHRAAVNDEAALLTIGSETRVRELGARRSAAKKASTADHGSAELPGETVTIADIAKF